MLARALSVACWLALLSALPPLCACSCDGPPRMETCRSPATDFSGVTSLAVADPRIVMGLQGGSHLQYQLTATGIETDCVSYRAELLDARGDVVTTFDGVVRARTSGGTLTTSTIYHIGYTTPGTVRITALGRTAEATIADPFARDTPVAADAGSDTGP